MPSVPTKFMSDIGQKIADASRLLATVNRDLKRLQKAKVKDDTWQKMFHRGLRLRAQLKQEIKDLTEAVGDV